MLPLELPAAVLPVLNTTTPLSPSVVSPVVRRIAPLEPLLPPLAVRTLKAPLAEARPNPVMRETAPPVLAASVASPAAIVTLPPTALSPRPTITLTLPPAPELAWPDRSITWPVEPHTLLPVANESEPEMPPPVIFACVS